MDLTPNNFIGRKKELAIYEEWLVDVSAPRILYFHDAATEPAKKGGVGKTSLMQRCIEITKDKYKDMVIVRGDFFTNTDCNGKTLAERVYNQLKESFPDWSADSFDKALQEEVGRQYQQTTAQRTDPIAIRNKLSAALIKDLHQLDIYLRDIPGPTPRGLLVALDTFEVIQDNPSVAVFSPIQTFPDTYHFDHIRFLLAGRDAINWEQPNWQGREHEVKSVALWPFNQDELISFMNSYEIQLDSPQAAILSELTGGRPILLGLVKDLVGLKVLPLTSLLSVSHIRFEEYLVSQINKIDKPINGILLFMAHAYHRFNSSLLEWVLHENFLIKSAEIKDINYMEILTHLSFIRYTLYERSDIALHDEMRSLITTYCWQTLDPEQSFRQAISHRVIQYYEDKLKDEQDELMRQSYTVQILYHRAFLDRKDGLQYFMQRFDEAINLWQNAYARTLLQEIQKFEKLLSTHQHADLVMEEARLFLKEENPKMARAYFKQLLEEADDDWLEEHKTELHYNLGECLLAMNSFQDASSSFDEALELERECNRPQKVAEILNSCGYIARRQGQFDQAADYYQESIRIYKALGNQPEYLRELANNFNTLGYVYSLQGKIEEALIYCQAGLHLRERLSRNIEVSPNALGLSYSTLAYIHLYDGNNIIAERYLKSAFDIFTRTNYKKGLALCHNRFGQIALKKKELDSALDHFTRAFNEADDIDDKEAQITSLNGQGQIHSLQDQDKARQNFEGAIELAMRVHDSYQEVESRVDLARILACQKELKRYSEELGQATAIAQQQHYDKLLGKIERLQGELSYQEQEYQDAFLHYAKFCHFMSQHNPIEYRKALRFLSDQLLKMDNTTEIEQALVALSGYWEEQQLGHKFPEFIKACSDIHTVIL